MTRQITASKETRDWAFVRQEFPITYCSWFKKVWVCEHKSIVSCIFILRGILITVFHEIYFSLQNTSHYREGLYCKTVFCSTISKHKLKYHSAFDHLVTLDKS